MSFKAKNLSYEAQEPSFLRKLRSQQSGRDNDRHEREIARPRKAKATDDDDAPTYVDEDDNTLSKEEYEAMVVEQAPSVEPERAVNGLPVDAATKSSETAAAASDTVRSKQEVTEVGTGQKKRKVAKIVAADADDVSGHLDVPKPKDNKKLKKKGKAVKLSFGIDEV